MNLPYDVVKDFEPVSLIADTPQWVISRKTLPANDVKELIAWLKANKATAGLGRRRRSDRSLGAQIPEADRHDSSSSCPIAAARRCCRT